MMSTGWGGKEIIGRLGKHLKSQAFLSRNNYGFSYNSCIRVRLDRVEEH
ncbi:hypothetical protein CK203_104623 [Vitis vinifera]|uniref:Uncharacterized protein n=1 Tax=Vitis vinifera TaxID=29760 RepID=A0A438DP85_VITVI|nr:hypothetical protein CK203_104623 [Vitis vinifera]